ncbi:cytochrome C oxidase subunit I [Neosynechococcus sphagnicola sy1]|uniref:Cytochrome C oxidase subunit I n=1 Tax=Neosynechococcus sphagnicola sy1 TaxID=1497020 RepID=A0A098TJK4_9CYAN|nr:heme A synthase [Neosynechococcus sphagnicola]KGF72361.1 cytochrome C oxidase subunit I [Neosynechococcus sphagnicola sy1]
MNLDVTSLVDTFPEASKLSQPLVQKRLRYFVWIMAAATLFLMALGSATRVMNAGLSCPDWPLCYGQLLPQQQMNLQVFLEWFHRLIASSMGFLAIALFGVSWWQRQQLPRWLPGASSLVLGLVVFQGILGGLTVTELLRFDIVTAHLGTGLLFFVTLVAIAASLTPYQGMGTVGKLPWISLSAAALVYLQSLLGGLVASQWALHQCLNASQLCQIMNSHILGVVPASLAILFLGVSVWRTPALHPLLRTLANLVSLLLLSQITLGVATFRLHLQVEPLTVAHQFVGAALLGTLTVFSVMALRDMTPDCDESLLSQEP